MSVMLICTLGNRDLQLSGKVIEATREKGLEIFENFDKYYPDLTYPLIRPVFRYIFEEERQEKIGRLILVATDQSDPAFRQKDTIEFARVLQRIIPKEYGAKVGQIKILKIPENPTYLDAMYDFFGTTLKDNKAFKSDNVFNMEELEVCYVEQTGGIPAANMALLYQCITRFREKCCPVNISEKYGAVPLNFVGKVMSDRKRSILLALADKYDYASMDVHLDEKKENEKFILRLSRYAQHRLYFDTLTARTVARQAMGEFSSEKNIFGNLISELEKVESGDDLSLILELFHNMRIKYLRQEFVDFLGRIYRFEEGVLRYIIESELGVTTKKEKSIESMTLARYIEENSEMSDFIRSQKTSDGEAVDASKHGLPRFNACLNYLIVEKGKDEYKAVYEIFRKFIQLINIRNKSIIGHGFDGVSEEIIKENYGGDVLEDLKAVVCLVLGKPDLTIADEPFERINRELTERIRRL